MRQMQNSGEAIEATPTAMDTLCSLSPPHAPTMTKTDATPVVSDKTTAKV